VTDPNPLRCRECGDVIDATFAEKIIAAKHKHGMAPNPPALCSSCGVLALLAFALDEEDDPS
jgi:hypothetical protein